MCFHRGPAALLSQTYAGSSELPRHPGNDLANDGYSLRVTCPCGCLRLEHAPSHDLLRDEHDGRRARGTWARVRGAHDISNARLWVRMATFIVQCNASSSSGSVYSCIRTEPWALQILRTQSDRNVTRWGQPEHDAPSAGEISYDATLRSNTTL